MYSGNALMAWLFTLWPQWVPNFLQQVNNIVNLLQWLSFTINLQGYGNYIVNSLNSQDKFQLCCTDMCLVWFLLNFTVMVFCIFLWISWDFAGLQESAAPWPHKISEALFLVISDIHVNSLNIIGKSQKISIPNHR